MGERVKWTHQAVYMHINLLRLSCIDSTSEQLAIAAGSSYVFAEVPILAVDCNANVRHKQDWCLAYGQLMLCFAGQLCVEGPSSQAMTNLPPRSRWCGTEPLAFDHFGLHATQLYVCFHKGQSRYQTT